MTAAGLVLQSIRVLHGRTVVLPDLSLDVAPGELLVLLGPSGSGKSTLLGAVAGLLPLAAGRVLLGGRDVTAVEPADREVALVFQSYALYPTMSVEQNITFGMRMRGVKRAERSRKLADAARLLQLEALLARKPAQLSGGQRQRVAIARALVRDPALFLFDEPLSNLDAQLRMETRAEIRLLQRRLGTTTLYVTHDQVEAMTLADRIAIMRDGHILQVGAPQTIYDRPESVFVARFVGSPGMNLLEGRVVAVADGVAAEVDGVRLPLGHYAWAQRPEPGRAILLGIRPEDVRPAEGGERCAASLAPTLVEPTGADLLLRVPFGGTALTARADRTRAIMPGQTVLFAFDLTNVSVFCPRTELRL